MLRKALNMSWREHVTNELLYGDLPKISTKIQTKRLKLADTQKKLLPTLCYGYQIGVAEEGDA